METEERESRVRKQASLSRTRLDYETGSEYDSHHI